MVIFKIKTKHEITFRYNCVYTCMTPALLIPTYTQVLDVIAIGTICNQN